MKNIKTKKHKLEKVLEKNIGKNINNKVFWNLQLKTSAEYENEVQVKINYL